MRKPKQKTYKTKWDKDAVKFSNENHKILFSASNVHETITQGLFIAGCLHAERKTLARIFKKLSLYIDDDGVFLSNGKFLKRIINSIAGEQPTKRKRHLNQIRRD